MFPDLGSLDIQELSGFQLPVTKDNSLQGLLRIFDLGNWYYNGFAYLWKLLGVQEIWLPTLFKFTLPLARFMV
eukprot:6357761-Amphidinium_carterae.2